uniref:Ribosome maturation factor RimM n=1 Tax=Anisakis simplex TaxID=6269 RepID=A0A0M3JP45_ANISI
LVEVVEPGDHRLLSVDQAEGVVVVGLVDHQ